MILHKLATSYLLSSPQDTSTPTTLKGAAEGLGVHIGAAVGYWQANRDKQYADLAK